MSKISSIITNPNSVLVFDVDGVLAKLEFGENTHHILEQEWNKINEENINLYNEDKVIMTMRRFIREKNINKIYVITLVQNDNESKFKKMFLNKYYNILINNIYCVKSKQEKINKLLEIGKMYPKLDDENIIMIDDSVEILDEVIKKTNFSTAHISSFLDY